MRQGRPVRAGPDQEQGAHRRHQLRQLASQDQGGVPHLLPGRHHEALEPQRPGQEKQGGDQMQEQKVGAAGDSYFLHVQPRRSSR